MQPKKLIDVLIVLAAVGLNAAMAAKTEKPATVNARRFARREGSVSNAASARRRLKKSVIIWVLLGGSASYVLMRPVPFVDRVLRIGEFDLKTTQTLLDRRAYLSLLQFCVHPQ